MIIHDTNVVSALMTIEPDRAIVPWLDAAHPEDFWITVITVYEIELGILQAKSDRSKRELAHAFESFRFEVVPNRILSYNEYAAFKAAHLTLHQ